MKISGGRAPVEYATLIQKDQEAPGIFVKCL